MQKKPTMFFLLILLALLGTMLARSDGKQGEMRIPNVQTIVAPSLREACQMTKYNGFPFRPVPFYSAVQIIQYFDPADLCGVTPAYPFEIESLSFSLTSWPELGLALPYPAPLDIVVYDLAPSGLKCDGPGAELCRISTIADSLTFQYPNMGTVTFHELCCVNGPFFLGIDVTGTQGPGIYPSIYVDETVAPDTCELWIYNGGHGPIWEEWNECFEGEQFGFPGWFVNGETNSPCVPCTWELGNPHKMHYPQLPNDTGYDVMGTSEMVLADDWECSQTGWVTDIHFWGGWKNDNIGSINSFSIKIYEDIPADPPQTPYSRPGVVLWEGVVLSEEFTVTEIVPGTTEGWWNPSSGDTIGNSSQVYYQYDICLEEPDWFWQDSGTVYWLSISAEVEDPATTEWGWKSSINHFNDNAVWTTLQTGDWTEMWEPAPRLIDIFDIEIDIAGPFISGGGENAFGDGWYFYPQDGWWNIWFYDHPFDSTRKKSGLVHIEVRPTSLADPVWVELALNWSTNQWSLDQGPVDSAPPLPGVDETLYIGREILYAGNEAPFVHSSYEIYDYNPEWISIGVRGYNFRFANAYIHHTCQGPIDLAFVITGIEPEPTEACCFPDSTCSDLAPSECINLGGTPQGSETSCYPMEACCFPDGSCKFLSEVCCLDLGGTPHPEGSGCADNTIACCFPDGTCETVNATCCVEMGGTPSPIGATYCLGDLNGDGFEDACYVREDLKWRQVPDLNTTGVDVDANCPSLFGVDCIVLADDFLCTETGPITEIHVFGSWFGDTYPNDDPGMVAFTLSLHSDVPAGVDLPWSHPGEMLWFQAFMPGTFDWRPIATQIEEGFYNAVLPFYEPVADFTCYEYIFYLDEPFIQQGTELEPVIYWLDVQAHTDDPDSPFGWKTSTDHWNDDAVWAAGEEPIEPSTNWEELVYPSGHPWSQQSIDLAFEIYGQQDQPCDCIPGDANNDGNVNVGDAVYVIAYVFKGGPPPVPYPICSGDANCDCQCNVGDAVYIISYVFKGGPPPCDCPTWLSICGPPLRK